MINQYDETIISLEIDSRLLPSPKPKYHLGAFLDANDLLMYDFVLLTHAPFAVVFSIRHIVTSTDVCPELAGWESSFEHFINLLECAVLDLW